MKKNVVGHMIAQKESVGKRIRRLGIFPFIVCLLLSLVVWLAVYEIKETDPEPDSPAQEARISAELIL